MVRSAAAVVAGNCLVAATLIDSWLPWRTSSSGNQTGLPSTGEPPSPPVMGDPPQGATSTSTTSVWWGEWNFRVLLGWTNLMVFSTPEQKGSLGTEGGWALYLLDKVGVISFGRYWPVAGWTALATLMIGLLTALVWSLKACEKWFCCGCGCRRRGVREGAQAVDPALRHLPVTATPTTYAPVTLVGPGSSTPVDTEYFQRQVRGRGAGRRPHDLVLRFPQGAVRMQPDWTHRTRIDRHGLWIKPGRILGVTARALREHLERADQIHLCRSDDCTQPGAYHCKEFAAIDADSVIDLGAYGRLDGWRALVLFWRGLRSLKRLLHGFLLCCSCRSCRRTTEAPRQIQDQGVIRPLDPDSESEAEQISDPCEAVLIGLELQGKPRALAPEGCDDKAAAEPTRLLVDDLQLSDECARLCNHHSQLYMLSCQGRKCSVISCFSKVHGAHKGTPLCSKHLAETGRSNSPAPVHGAANRRPEESLLHSIRRSQSADTRLENGPSRIVRFEEPSSPDVGHQRLSSSEYEKPSRVERAAHPKAGAPVLVRLHPFFGSGVKTCWFIFLGEVEGIAEDSRRTERAAVKVSSLGLRVSLPWHCLGEPPLTDQSGRYPRTWLQEFLYSAPTELEDRGVSIQVSQVAPQSWEWLREWEGREVNSKEAPSASLRPEQLRQLVKEPRLVLLPHDEGLVLTKGVGNEGDEFGTPPRPPTISVSAALKARSQEVVPPQEVDSSALHDSFRDARVQGASIGEAIALVASAYNIGPEIVQMSVLGALEGTRDESKEEVGIGKDPLAWSERRPSLTGPQVPPPPLPPGLTQESGLVQARVTPPDNHLLASSDGLPEAVARLFPTSGIETTPGLVSVATGALSLHQPSIGLGQGLVRKAGAAFGEQLGPSDPTLATDRIIHAIDGLRKAQDEDKTGTKGQVSSIKEGEKLDVFLARGCGQLSIELCKGVYGKELFHSIKRAGLHAKHELSLIKWPVLITNRVALSIAGLWWGGTESFTLLAADCATARVEQIENWSPPTEHKIEARGRAPTTFLTWLRYAENSIKVFGSAYGLEHVRERNKFLQALREAHEEDENAFPFTYCVQLFEEMTAVWCEEIRESRRRLCAKLGTENPRLEDFKLVALSPSATGQANFQFPRVWDLADPAGYYQRVILPRQNKAMARLLNKQLHDHVTKEKRPDHRKTAGPLGITNPSGTDAPSLDVEDTDKTGRAPRLALRPDPNKAGDALKAYPAGKRLSPAEVKRSIQHAPQCPKTKKPICWDAACHIGCHRSNCPNAHEPLPKLSKLDYTVATQVLRRGGLRSGPKVNPQEVDGRVAQLRTQAKEEQASKIEPGATAQGKAKAHPKAKAKDKAGWAVPEDYQGPVTQLEHELGNLAEGPDYSWHQQFRHDTEVTSVQAGTAEAQKRKEVYEKLLADKKLAPLAGCSDHLHSHVASHFVNAEMQGKVVQLSDILTQAIDYGHPQLAEEAQEVWSAIGVKAGLNLPEPEARFDTFVWTEGVGKGQMIFNHPLWEGVPPLGILDAQDKLTLPDDLRVALQLEQAEEMRQCLCLHVALAFEGDLTTAWEHARDLRRELWEESSAAFQHLGDASPYISTAEAFVRHNAHDCIYPDHEKDFRVLQLFARRFMQGRLLGVIRLSHQGIVEIDTVRGAGAIEAYGAVVTHRGHMRTAQCPAAQVKQLLEIATQGARVIRELEVDGWGSFLEAQDASGDIIPSKPHPCYRCRRPQTPCKAGVEEDDAGDPARPSVDISLCGGTAHSSPRRFSLFVPVSEMDSEVVRALGAEDTVTVRPLPDAQSGQHAWCTWAISQPGPTLASDCWVLWLKSVTFEGAGGPALLDCLKAALSGFSGTLLLVVPALTALLARQLRGLHLRLIPRADCGNHPIWWCVSESLWAGLAPFASRAVTGPEGQVLLDWCRWVLSGDSALPEWTGELVLYVTDNMNVKTWLHKRRPRNRASSLLIRLVQRLESENHFTVHPVYIRTYRNQLADWLSREDLQLVRKQLVADGWTEVATGLQWEEFLRDAERSALVYPTGDDPQGKVARQLTHSAELAPRPLKQVCLRVPWQPLHVEEYPEVTSCGVALRLFGIWRPGDHPFAWYTFSQDPSGRERKRFEKVLKAQGHRLRKIVVDCPRQLDSTCLEQIMEKFFPNVETCQYISSHLGAITARRRTVCFGWKGTFPPPKDLGQFRANPPPSMQMIPLDSGTASEVSSISGVLTQEPGIVTTGDPWLPHPFGHIKGPGVPPKCLVHKVTGPACAFVGPTKDIKGPGATLIPSGTGSARRLSLGEIARAQGLTAPQWIGLSEALGQEEALRRIIQEPGWQVAAAILGLWQEEPLKTGNCLDPDEEAACQQLEVWLQAWKANPERPREMLDLLHTQAHEGPIQEPTLWPDAGDTRVGGRSAKDPEDRKLVTPVLLGEERDRFSLVLACPVKTC